MFLVLFRDIRHLERVVLLVVDGYVIARLHEQGLLDRGTGLPLGVMEHILGRRVLPRGGRNGLDFGSDEGGLLIVNGDGYNGGYDCGLLDGQVVFVE